MKKLILIMFTLLFLTGCGMSKEEKEKMLYDSLEKAFVTVYSAEGLGLAVYGEKTLEIDGEIWYQVAISKYNKLSTLETLADDVYESKIAKELKNTLNTKYKETDTELYFISKGGCKLDYNLDDNLVENLKKDIKIKKYGFMDKVVFEYKGKEYTAKKSKDNYVFDSKIFECPSQEE